jgi:hypothetical protein
MILARVLCLCSLALSADSPATAPTSTPGRAIIIDTAPPTVDRVMFDRDHLPGDMPTLKPGEAALTRSSFECRAGVTYHILSKQQMGDHWHAVIRVARVNFTVRLVDTLFLPMGAPILLRAHEEGHREMNERIYNEGIPLAHSAAAAILTHNWQADGADSEAAARAASDLAVNEMCQTYLAGTAARSSRLGDIYDRFTSHGRNQMYVANAIRLSFLEEKRLPATRPAELLHATTSESR